MTRALVLGGGGITGIAWEIGLLLGLRDAGVDLTDADTIVGTSAGSVVGAQVAGGIALEAMYDAQLADPRDEIGASMGHGMLLRWLAVMLLPGDGDTKRRRLGHASLKAAARPDAVPAEARIEVIRSRLPVQEWPDRDLRITTVDAETGRFVVLDRSGDVDLVHAVASSCAVPLVWPPVPVAGRHFIDGGVRSSANADVVRDVDEVVVLAPLPQSFSRAHRIEAQLARTGASGTASVSPDKESLAAIGKNVLDPTNRAAAARAGRRQAGEVVDGVRQAWQRVSG